MKKSYLLIFIISLVFAVSCSKKVPETANSIPDHAFVVGSFHPKQLFEKGQISTMDNITGKIKNEILTGIIKDPAKSGIDMNDYILIYMYLLQDDLMIGTTGTIKDPEEFTNMMHGLIEKKEEFNITSHEGFKFLTPNSGDAGMAWNDDQFIFLSSPNLNLPVEEWQDELIALFNLKKENAVTSIVDFIDFSGKMKDMNLWLTGDKLEEVIKKSDALKGADMQLPLNLENNYAQLFVEFDDGAMYANSEVHFNDDTSSAAASMMISKEELNSDLLTLTPGHNLLMAMAYSVDIDKAVKLIQGVNPSELNEASEKIEKITGIPGEEIIDALNGDFVLAVNGAEKASLLPVEILLGIGLDDKTLQDKMMGAANNMAEIKRDGDFFIINILGFELYSGIVDGLWVITNTPGYKDAISGKGLEKDLTDSKFNDFADGSMGMYLNLDLSTYPPALKTIAPESNKTALLNLFTESFLYMGMEASNKTNNLVLKTNDDQENSLYTIFKIIDQAAEKN